MMMRTPLYSRAPRCQAARCKEKLDEQKAKVKELQKNIIALETELTSVRSSGLVNILRAELKEKSDEVERLSFRLRDCTWRLTSAHSLTQRLGEEKAELANRLAAETLTVARLGGRLGALAKKAASGARARALAAEAGAKAVRHEAEKAISMVVKRAKVQVAEADEKLREREALLEARRRAENERAQRQLAQVQARVVAANAKVRTAESRAADALESAKDARAMARDARKEAMHEAEVAKVAVHAKNAAEAVAQLHERRETYAKEKAAKLQAKLQRLTVTHDRTPEEWAALNAESRRKAAQREREHLRGFFTSHNWRVEDVAQVLAELKVVEQMFETRPFFDVFYKRVRSLMTWLERECYGLEFGLFLHFDMRLTIPKILQITQAACKRFDRAKDRYFPKSLLYDKFHVSTHQREGEPKEYQCLNVPRLAPPQNKLTAAIREIESQTGVKAGENGLMAFKSFDIVIQEMLACDPGSHGMPALSAYMGGELALPIVISFDGTGYGKLQFNTAAVRNPFLPQSAQLLRIFGLGNCGDDRTGTKRVLGPNLEAINKLITTEDCTDIVVRGEVVSVKPEIFIVTDVAAMRHTEHMTGSGWCCCTRDFALRTTPKKPMSVREMKEDLLPKCHGPTRTERFVLAHHPFPGEALPRPCIAPGCVYGHNRATAAKELADLLAAEADFMKDDSKKGKARFSEWRRKHASTHLNVCPGAYGAPMFEHDFSHQIIDALHLSLLNLAKIPWKHGILCNASDDARERISDQLKVWKHGLDCKRKEDNRSREQKWFTGEAWSSFMQGHGGSPGGPIAIATLVLIIADDMQERGVTIGSGEANAAAKPVPGGRGKQAFAARNAATAASTSAVPAVDGLEPERAKLLHVPSQMQLAADPEDIDMIKTVFGSRGQTILNALLAFDAYFRWYFPFKASVPLFCSQEEKDERALSNCQAAIDMHEAYERLSIRNHKSFMPHAAIYKATQDILQVGDLWAFSLSALELQNAETKRTACSSASRRLTLTSTGEKRQPLGSGKAGPASLITTKGYSTTMAISTLKNLLSSQILRRGSGLYATPATRRKERLFGVGGTGRSSLPASGVKQEQRALIASGYDPQKDTCIKAFVRLLSEHATNRRDSL